MGLAQRRQHLPAVMDLRIDTLALSDERRKDSETSRTSSNKNTDSSYTYEEDEGELDIRSPNRDSYYTPSSERHVRWSAELAGIIDSPYSPPKKGLHKLLQRRRSSSGNNPNEVLVSPHQGPSSCSPESSSAERKQGRRIMTPKGSYLKSKRRVS